LAELLPPRQRMKPVLRLVKNGRAALRKQPVAREQRFRVPAEEVWEVSCGPAKDRHVRRETRKAS
jgi:hypothetical protein